MKSASKLDYVELYAEKLKKDNSLFVQQKKLIEAQLKSSSDLTRKRFSKDFKVNVRKYLRAIELLK